MEALGIAEGFVLAQLINWSIILILPLISAVWVYRDARTWDQPGWLWALAAFFVVWPSGLII